MNPEAKAELDRILALSPAELTEDEKAFLAARRSYLTEEQRITFGVTEPKVAATQTEAEEAQEEMPPRTPRRTKR